jgi:small subunit ribosomal protein S21
MGFSSGGNRKPAILLSSHRVTLTTDLRAWGYDWGVARRQRGFTGNARGDRVRALIGQLRSGVPVQVLVRDNNVDQALRALKKKMQREGVFREMKLRRNYEKPSERRAREKAEAVRRYRKLLRKRMEREGY